MRGKRVLAASLAIAVGSAVVIGFVDTLGRPTPTVPPSDPEFTLPPAVETLSPEQLSNMAVLTTMLGSLTPTEVCGPGPKRVPGTCFAIDERTAVAEGLREGDSVEIGYPTAPGTTESMLRAADGPAYYVQRSPYLSGPAP